MGDELLPKPGRMVTENGEYLTASSIAALNIVGMPKTRAGVYKRAEKEGWPVILRAGRGASDGVKYFLLPDTIYKSLPVKDLAGGDDRGISLAVKEPTTTYSVEIDEYVDVNGHAGPGQEVPEEAVVKVRMDIRLLRERVGSNFGNLKIAGVTGDSMEPTLSHGDQVVVDTSCDRFIDDAIYAIQQDGLLRFKRIKLKLDGSIIVKSDNVIDNEPETYTADQAQYFKIVGRVIPFKFGRFKL